MKTKKRKNYVQSWTRQDMYNGVNINITNYIHWWFGLASPTTIMSFLICSIHVILCRPWVLFLSFGCFPPFSHVHRRSFSPHAWINLIYFHTFKYKLEKPLAFISKSLFICLLFPSQVHMCSYLNNTLSHTTWHVEP